MLLLMLDIRSLTVVLILACRRGCWRRDILLHDGVHLRGLWQRLAFGHRLGFLFHFCRNLLHRLRLLTDFRLRLLGWSLLRSPGLRLR